METSSDPCNEAFDGIATGTDNGWAYNGNTPAWAEFTLASASPVNQLDILTGVGKTDHHITDFKVELRVGGDLRAPENAVMLNAEASVDGAHIQVQKGCFLTCHSRLLLRLSLHPSFRSLAPLLRPCLPPVSALGNQ